MSIELLERGLNELCLLVTERLSIWFDYLMFIHAANLLPIVRSHIHHMWRRRSSIHTCQRRRHARREKIVSGNSRGKFSFHFVSSRHRGKMWVWFGWTVRAYSFYNHNIVLVYVRGLSKPTGVDPCNTSVWSHTIIVDRTRILNWNGKYLWNLCSKIVDRCGIFNDSE